MPSLEHESLIELFRRQPSFIAEILSNQLHAPLPAWATITATDASAVLLPPPELGVDLVLLFHDAQGATVYAALLEVQRAQDADKPYTWPAYLTSIRARHRCPTCVVVLTLDKAVETWAHQRIELGYRAAMTPLVLGPSTLPLIRDAQRASQNPTLTLLSALVHGNHPRWGLAVVKLALKALNSFEARMARLYFLLLLNSLDSTHLQRLRATMLPTNPEEIPFPDIVEEYVAIRLKKQAEALLKEVEKGRQEGIQAGMEKGILQNLHQTVLRLAERRGLSFSPEQKAYVLACSDIPTLESWLDKLLTATTPEEVLRNSGSYAYPNRA